MRTGRLRHRLVLQSKSYSQDEYGAAITTWTTQATVWGAIEPLSGREYFAQQQTQSESKVRIVIRYQSSVDTTYRIKHGGLYYDIEDIVNHDMRNRTLTLMCRQGVSEDYGDESSTVIPAPPAPTFPKLLLETGDYLLLESGDKLLLET